MSSPTDPSPASTSPPQQPLRAWQTTAAPWIVFALLATAVGAVYTASADAPLFFDDVPCIENNPSIRQLWPPLGTKESPGPLRPPQDFNTAGRPLVNLSYALNIALGGLESPRADGLVE